MAQVNFFRYRGYYYDVETGFYSLSSRYYDPKIGRFISPEPNVDFGGFDEGAGLLAHNVYAYCANNPVMYKDETGESITLTCIIVGAIIGAAVGGYIGHKQASKAGYTINDGWKYLKYVLGYGTVGAGAGALIGWGVGAAATAIGAYMTAGSGGTLGTIIYQNWQKCEQAVRSIYNGVSKAFDTPFGRRIVDCFTGNKAMEVKYGYQSLSSFIQQEIAKDSWLLRNGYVKAVEWHFYVSQATGKGGPSGPLLKELLERGFKVIFH